MENAYLFEKKENLEIITKIAESCLNSPDERVIAVACYDLGQFSRFFPFGKDILNRLGVKEKMTALMKDSNMSANVKKEAITCYQKILMNQTWVGNDFTNKN